MNPFIEKHKRQILAVLAIALFGTAALLLGRAGILGGTGNLTGSLTGFQAPSRTLGLSNVETPVTRGISTKTPGLAPTITTGTLTVAMSPSNASFELYDYQTGITTGPMTGSKTLTNLSFGNYKVTCRPLAGYESPSDRFPSLTQAAPTANIVCSYKEEAIGSLCPHKGNGADCGKDYVIGGKCVAEKTALLWNKACENSGKKLDCSMPYGQCI